jgi:citronellol/citronellal dehydrogenase
MDMSYVLTNEYYRDKPLPFAPGLFRDKVVLISGGGTGIGKAAAWQAARLGAQVVICQRNAEYLSSVAGAIREAGLSCRWTQLNIRDTDAVNALIDGIYQTEGRLDLQINSAGGQFTQPAVDYSPNGWRSVIDTNLNGTFNMMQSAARKWLAADAPGSIVTITFSARGLHQMAHTVAARAGITAFMESVAVEWAPKIRVNCVAPGSVASDHFSFAEKELYSNSNPMLNTGTPWDVAAACLFIGGDTAPFITGQTLRINGGADLWGESWPLGKPERYVKATAAWTDARSAAARAAALEGAVVRHKERKPVIPDRK